MLFADAFAEEIESYRHRPVAGTGTPESDALDVLKRYLQEPNPYVPVSKALVPFRLCPQRESSPHCMLRAPPFAGVISEQCLGACRPHACRARRGSLLPLAPAG